MNKWEKCFQGIENEMNKHRAFCEDIYKATNKNIDHAIFNLSKNNSLTNTNSPVPWSHVDHTLRFIGEATKIRKEWRTQLENEPFLQTAIQACSLHDKMLLPINIDIDSKVYPYVDLSDFFLSYEGDISKNITENPLNLIETTNVPRPIAIEYIDGYAIAFERLSDDNTTWETIPIRGRSLFDYDQGNVSIVTELSDYYDVDPEELKCQIILYTNHNDIINFKKFCDLEIKEPTINRNEVTLVCAGTIHIDLTMDRLAIGIVLRGKLHWRFFPEWSLRNWLRHIVKKYSPEFKNSVNSSGFEKEIKLMLLRNQPRDFFTDEGDTRQIIPSDLRIDNFVKCISQTIPDAVENILLSGWLNTSLAKEAIKKFSEMEGGRIDWNFGQTIPLSLWQHSIMRNN